MKMKAAVLYEINKPLVIEELEVPKLGLGQVLVKLKASGVCHTQIDNIKGNYGEDPYLPHLLGHEGAGIVKKVGPGITKVSKGDHVILSWIQGNGINGSPPKYKKGNKIINAGFVTTFNEYCVASETRVTSIRKDISFDIASLFGCAVSTGLGAAINESKIEPGKTVAVFGVGGVGINIIQGAVLTNALKIIAVDINERKLKFAKKFGATHVINAKREKDPVKKIKEITNGEGVDYAFDSAGGTQCAEQAYQAANNSGLINLVGNPINAKKICIDALQTHYGKKLIGGHGGHTVPFNDFSRYIELYLAKKIKLDELLGERYSLYEINKAISALEKGDVVRPIIEF